MTTDRTWLSRTLVLGAAALLLILSHYGLSGLLVWPLVAALACAVIVDDSPFRSHAATRANDRTSDRTPELVEPHAVVKASYRKRVLIVGAGVVGRTLAESLEGTGRYQVIGFVDDEPVCSDDYRWKVLGGRDVTADIVAQEQIDEIVLAHAPTWKERLTQDMVARHPEVAVRVVPTTYEALLRVGRVESHGDIAVADLVTRAGNATEVVKRISDLIAASVLLILSAPLSLLAAIAIKLTSPGPIIFAQERVGRFGKEFIVYKFRTMVPDAEARTGPVLANGRNDDRLTKVGKFLRLTRIDEVPQLWNVLRGEMSLVGPRPERPTFARKFEQVNAIYAMRHQVRPGITGLAQICGGYHTSWRDKLRFDLIYVSHQSIWLDFTILVRTVLVCIIPRGHERKEE